jgi:hypothetical protein
MSPLQYSLIALLAAHLIVAAFAIVSTVKTNEFSKKQKTINIILILLIPFVWAFLIHYLLNPERGSFEVEVKNDVSSNNFDESGLGAPGSGISSR